MNTLFLSGYGISLRVDNGKLIVKDGNDQNRKDVPELVFRPKFIEYDNIVIYGHTGKVTLDALRWISKQNIQLVLLDWNGRVLSTVMVPELMHSRIRLAQYRTCESNGRVGVSKAIIEAKIKNSLIVLDWIKARYPEVADIKKECFKELNTYDSRILTAKTNGEVRGIEGIVARNYWDIVSTAFGDHLEFEGRNFGKSGRPIGAVDPINALFNYGYGILESWCWRAINANGLDPYVGFLHEMGNGKAPLVYDLQEPYRWLVDVAIINALETEIFKRTDFILTDNYNIRIRPEGVKKLVAEIGYQFEQRAEYNKKQWEWGNIITQKSRELANFVTGERKTLDFCNPTPELIRDDTAHLRQKILDMPYTEWKKLGFSKGTLHYLKQNAKKEEPFQVYGKVREKLETIRELGGI